jgi:hypothetical protein
LRKSRPWFSNANRFSACYRGRAVKTSQAVCLEASRIRALCDFAAQECALALDAACNSKIVFGVVHGELKPMMGTASRLFAIWMIDARASAFPGRAGRYFGGCHYEPVWRKEV